MFLRTLTVENFRSIRSGRLDFDDTTVLIGENDSGKSSLFTALALALAAGDEPPRFEDHHFHRDQGTLASPPVGPIRIALLFEERSHGEWDRLDSGALKPLLAQKADRPRQLILRIEAAPPAHAGPVEGEWSISSPASRNHSDDPAALSMLRSLNRLLHLRGGSLFTPGVPRKPPAPVTGTMADPELRSLAREIESHYQALVSGTAKHEQSELKAGYEAALELLSRRDIDFFSAGALSGSLVEEILDQRGLEAGGRQQAFHGSAAQQVGVLILVAALLRRNPGKTVSGGEYIMILEDPEAHLHLMTLASVWGVLEQLPAQKIISTQSGTLLASTPLHSMRRLTRSEGIIRQWRVHRNSLKNEELRKLSYHIRVRRADASFARCWILVEGETEFWIIPELARLCGYDLAVEGIACVEFAQSGLVPLIKLARELGIEWHVLADGDKAGKIYAEKARSFLGDEPPARRITALRQRDIEHCFWKHGYEHVFAKAARVNWRPDSRQQPRSVINRAIRRHSKPYLAFELIVAVAEKDSAGVPAPLQRMLETCIGLARRGVRAD